MFKQTPKRRVLLVHRLMPVLVLLFGVFSLLGISLHSPRLAYASAADTVNFQARLQTAAGSIVPDGDYNVEFKLYAGCTDEPTNNTGCTAVWTEDYLNSSGHGLQAVNGYITTDLGSITSFPSTIDWSQQLYLSMDVGGTGSSITQSYSVNASGWDGEMNPRLALTATPYAFEAQQATQAGELSTTDGANTSTLIIQGSTHGDQTFEIQDQGAEGPYYLLTTAQANNSYIQLQSGTPVQQTGEIDMSGSATAGSIDTSSIDTATSGAIDIGGANATAINLGNTTTNIATTINGTVLVKPTSGNDSTTAFRVQNAAGTTTDFDVDTTDGRIGIGTAAPNYTLDVAGDINTSANYLISGTTALSSTALDFTNTTVPAPSSLGFSSTATAAGNSLSIIGQGGSTTATGAAGGTVFLQGGAAGGTAANNGGGLTLQGGAGTETGVGGQLTLDGGYAGIHTLSTLYAYPTLSSWSQVESAYPTDDATIVDICAPDGTGSGCNGSPADAIAPAWSPTIAALDNAGVTPLFYIATTYGATSLATIEGEMQNAYTWYGITNFAFDEMDPSGSCANGSSALTCTTYYNDLYTYAVSMGANMVLFNPGSTYDVSTADMFGSKEVLEVYEGTAANFETTTFPSWMSSYPASEFSVAVNSGTTSTIGTDVSDAIADGIGNFYENDETGTINYATLPAFWTTEISDVSKADGTEGSVSIDAGAGGTLGSGSIDIGDSYAGTISIGNNSLAHTTIGGSSEIGSDVVLQADGITDTLSGSTTAPSDILKASSTDVFQVQNASGVNVFNVDTTDQQVSADQNSSSTTSPIMSLVQNGSSSSTLALQNNATSSAFYLSNNASNSNALTINSYTSATTLTATPTAVQYRATASSTSATTQTLAFTSNNTAGNTIIVAASWQDTGITPTCTDTQNNTYSVMVTETDATNDSQSGICYATNIKAGADTVTVTYGTTADPISPSYRSLAIQEYSGIATANPVDTYTANTATGTTATNGYTSTATATAVSGDLIFGFFTDETGSSATAAAGTYSTLNFAQRTLNTTLGSPVTTEDLVQPSAGPIAATQTESLADEYVGMMMAFEPGTVTTGSFTNTNSNALLAMGQSGQTTFKNSTNSISAFQIQNASSAAVFNVNTTGGGSVAITNNVSTVSPAITSQTSGWEWNNNADGLSTLSVSPHTIGDLMMFVYDNGGTGNIPTNVSGGDVTSWHFVKNATNQDQYIYEGTVTSTGTNNIMVTYSGGSPTGWGEMTAQEFSSAYGMNTAWNVVAAGTDYGTTTSVPFPGLTTTQAGQLYWGYAGVGGQLQTTPTSGCPTSFSCVSTAANDFTIYDASTTANMSYAPVATETGTASSELGVIISAAPISGLALSVSGSSMVAANSTAAFQVQNTSGDNLLTVDTVNNAIVLGPDGTPTNVIVRGGVATGTNVNGSNITFQASDGTGSGGSGSFVFQTAAPGGAIGVDNSALGWATSGPIKLNYTTGAESNRLMVVHVEAGCGTTTSGITYDGVALTQLATGNSPDVDGGYCAHAEIWYLLNPPSGTYSLVGTLDDEGSMGVTTFYNVNELSPFGAVASASGTTTGNQATSLGVTATSPAQIVYDAIAIDETGSALTNPGTGQTELSIDNATSGLYDSGTSYKQGASGTVAMSWDVSSGDWLDIGVPINASGTSTGANSLSDSLLINNAGYVGIDNDDPQYSLDVSGSARVESISNSTTAFQIQNASGANVFSVDTANGDVNIGTGSTGEGTAKLLVLDSETGGGAEPTEVNGGMYYNATLGAFRCGIGGAWVNCVNGVATQVQTYAGTEAALSAKAATNTVLVVPIYIPGQITINQMRIHVTTALGAAGDVGLYNSSGTLLLDGGASSLATTTGVKTITPTQTGSARIIPAGQYYAAVTWNSATGVVSGAALTSGAMEQVGTLAVTGSGGNNLTLPSTITPSSITSGTQLVYISFNN